MRFGAAPLAHLSWVKLARGLIARQRKIEFSLLGPLEVSAEGEAVALGPPQQRSLLALLLLNANEVVSRDRIVDELWGEHPPATAAKLVQVYVSALRKLLEPGRGRAGPNRLLITRTPGYLVEIGPDDLDLTRVESLRDEAAEALARGDAAAARSKLGHALSLWRGQPLADFAYESFAQTAIARLEELRLAVLEERIEVDLELGADGDLVGELEELVEQHPVRERFRAQLMLALYRAGRQADALDVYQAARKALTEGLGIEPGRQLRDLQEAILRQDPLLDIRPTAESRTESSPRVFVGRERELSTLLEALGSALQGHGRLVLIAGEPGIGKSRLADELMAEARARAVRVCVGRCWEAGGAPAYWPWVQSLRAYVRDTEPDVLRPQLGSGAGELAELLPELRGLFPELPEPSAPESEGARFRLFEAVAAFLRSATQDGPLVLVLDDLHAADDPSLLLLRFLGREIADSRLLVVCAFRDVDPTLRDPLTSAVSELVREPHTMQIGLAGLSQTNVSEYIERSTGQDAEAAVAQAIHAETDGNPLFVGEVVRLLEAEGHIDDPDAQVHIPPGVRAVIEKRVERLSSSCRELLISASVMGREFRLDALGQLAELEREPLLDTLDEALGERLLAEVPRSPGRLRFSHALIRDTLYDELPSARRLQLHRDAARVLETVHSTDLEPHLAELAHHFFAAAPTGTAKQAVDYARRAGDRAASQLAYEEAERLYEMALHFVEGHTARCDLLLALGDAQARAGDTAASRESFRAAGELAERLELGEQLARAALGYGGRIIWQFSRGDIEHARVLERALGLLDDKDSPLRVRLLTRLAAGPLRGDTLALERSRSLSGDALKMARRVGDPTALAYALAGYCVANHSPDFTPKQAQLASECLDAAIATGDLERAADAVEHRLAARLELGDMHAVKGDLASMAKLADDLRQPSQVWYPRVYGGLVALLEGDFPEAERLMESARRAGEHALGGIALVSYAQQLYMLRREQGRLEEAETVVRQTNEEYPACYWLDSVRAHMAAELGDTAAARAALDAVAEDGFASIPFDEEWLLGLGLLAETVSALGATEHAPALYGLLLPYSDRVALSYTAISTGSVARNLGLLATVMERWDDAEAHFEDALELNERLGARPWHARTQRDYAHMLADRARAGDEERAAELTRRALGS